jgi:hypothetical protein
MKDFDIKRFKRLLVWDLLSNKKIYLRYITIFGVLFCAILLYFFFLMWAGHTAQQIISDSEVWESTVETTYMTFGLSLYGILWFCMFVGATRIFENTKTKQQRIAYFMQPASNIEKYLSRWLIYTVGFVLMFFAGLIVVDIIQYILVWICLAGAQRSITCFFLQNLFDYLEIHVELALPTAVLIAIHPYCILCGTFFRKAPTLMTIVLSYAITFICAFAVIIVDELHGFTKFDESISGYMSLAALILFTAASYFLSYKMFTRMQVVGKKWINI